MPKPMNDDKLLADVMRRILADEASMVEVDHVREGLLLVDGFAAITDEERAALIRAGAQVCSA